MWNHESNQILHRGPLTFPFSKRNFQAAQGSEWEALSASKHEGKSIPVFASDRISSFVWSISCILIWIKCQRMIRFLIPIHLLSSLCHDLTNGKLRSASHWHYVPPCCFTFKWRGNNSTQGRVLKNHLQAETVVGLRLDWLMLHLAK